MADESAADDQALYDVWDHLTAVQVATLFDLVDVLAERLAAGPTPPERPALRAVAVLLVAFRLGHLPAVIAALELEP
jgi:hypothetical protein